MFNKQLSKITNNPIGAVVGGVAGFYAAKKFGNVTNKWMLIGVVVVGVVVGAMAQSMIKAQAGQPKATDVKN
jgi:hypothetical protein